MNIHFVGNSKTDNSILANFLKNASIDDMLYLSRYVYSNTDEILISDDDYDKLMKLTKNESLKTKSYEEDILPEKITEIVEKLGLTKKTIYFDEDKQNLLNEFSSNKSVRYFKEIEDLLVNFKTSLAKGAKHEVSFKHDGWNITLYYKDGNPELVYAHTRGRSGAEVIDCTDVLKHLAPKLQVKSDTKIVGELVIRREFFEELREELPDREWVNIRSSISSFVRGLIDSKYYKALAFKAFNIESKETKDLKRTDKIDFLRNLGFDTPYNKHCFSKDEMVSCINEMMYLYETDYGNFYECDGLIISTDSGVFGEDDLYSNDLVAYKGMTWGSEVLYSVVEEITISFNKKRFTPIAIVKPVKSRIGNVIRRVPLVNLATIVKYGVNVGSKIEIEYQSQQNVYFKGVVV